MVGGQAQHCRGVKAFLLAAGVGRRLGKLTEETPKCLLPVGGKPLMDYWIEAFERAGVAEVLVNLHHLPKQVEKHIRKYPSSIRFKTFYEEKLLGSAGTISKAWDFVSGEEQFLIVYADNYAEVDLSRLVRFHGEKGNPPLTLLAYRTDRPSDCGVLEIDGEDRVIGFEEKPACPRSDIVNAGIHVAGPELKSFLPAVVPADLGYHVLPKIVGRMFCLVTDECIIDVGTPESYVKADERSMLGRRD